MAEDGADLDKPIIGATVEDFENGGGLTNKDQAISIVGDIMKLRASQHGVPGYVYTEGFAIDEARTLTGLFGVEQMLNVGGMPGEVTFKSNPTGPKVVYTVRAETSFSNEGDNKAWVKVLASRGGASVGWYTAQINGDWTDDRMPINNLHGGDLYRDNPNTGWRTLMNDAVVAVAERIGWEKK